MQHLNSSLKDAVDKADDAEAEAMQVKQQVRKGHSRLCVQGAVALAPALFHVREQDTMQQCRTCRTIGVQCLSRTRSWLLPQGHSRVLDTSAHLTTCHSADRQCVLASCDAVGQDSRQLDPAAGGTC